ncbi:signal peptidase I [Dermacoccaceae bacterium W4C1]
MTDDSQDRPRGSSAADSTNSDDATPQGATAAGAPTSGRAARGDNEGEASATEPQALAPGAVPEDEEPEAPAGIWVRLREYALVIVIALGLSFMVKTFVTQPFWIPSGSMENTLIPGDRIIVNKLPWASDPTRGDIIVFEDPDNWLPPAQESTGAGGAVKKGLQFVGLYPAGEQHLVKRVIGVGGDRVVCCDAQGRISVNGQPLNETYLREGEVPSTEEFDITVPKGKLWVMGDNRSHSGDSRAHDDGTGKLGSVPVSAVTGKVWAVVWPVSRWQLPGDAHQVFAKVPAP